MILYIGLLVLMSAFFMSTGWVMDGPFRILGIPTGLKSVAIQALVAVICVLILSTRPSRGIMKDLQRSVLFWIPWLLYAALRTDFDDHFSAVYFGKLVVVQFVGVLALTVAYKSSPAEFDRYFLWVFILLGVAEIAQMILNPDIFIYASVVKRLTIEDTNPIWLARGFATAAICILFLPRRSLVFKVIGILIFTVAIIPTGSRAPLIALAMVIAVYFFVNGSKTRNIHALVVFSGILLIVLAFMIWPYIEPYASDYFSRGSGKGALLESGRPGLFLLAIKEFISSPLIGTGIGKFGSSGSMISFSNATQGHAHNLLLEVLSSAGLVGLVLFGMTFRFGKWTRSLASPYSYLLLLSFLCAMTSGDLTTNNGVVFFAVLSRLAYNEAKESARRSARHVASGATPTDAASTEEEQPAGAYRMSGSRQ